MATKEEEFLKKLQEAFKVEADEHLEAMSSGLLALEKTPAADEQLPLLETVYREAHSLKGAARAVNMADVETVCQALENIFSTWKRGKMQPSPELFDTLHHAIDTVGRLLSAPAGQQAAGDNISGLTQRLARMETNGQEGAAPASARPVMAKPAPAPAPVSVPPPVSAPPAAVNVAPAEPPSVLPRANGAERGGSPPAHEKPVVSDTVRISTAKLDTLLRQAEEMLTVKLTASQRAADLRKVEADLEDWEKRWAKIYPEFRSARQLAEKGQQNGRGQTNGSAALQSVKLLDFLDWNQAYVKSLEGRLTALARAAEKDRRDVSSMVDNLLEDTKKLLMLPFGTLLGIFPKLVRDLSRDQGKEVQLLIHGSDVEIDKRILEEMKDPLIHLLRNSVDHGVERPEERARAGKPSQATITVAISQVSGSEVEIVISDDGEGIDVAQVKAAAVKRGFIYPEEAGQMSDQQALALIYHSDVSTSPIITEISGRGLGLAIVREKVEKLNGRIAVDTAPGRGTSFRIVLPLTLATFKGILVQAADQTFILPIANVERVDRIGQDQIKTVENTDTIPLKGGIVSLVRLDDVLELPRPVTRGEEANYVPVVVLGTGEKRIAFRVDEVLNEQEVLVKPLGKPLTRVRNVAGATVLGTGKAVPILNAADLIKSAMKVGGMTTRAAAGSGEVQSAAKAILIAEDSITSRMLLKNILESAGYQVTTAVDGMDALTALRSGDFALVCSDVDMPRMNGFDLTASIRRDKRLAEMPVVLVTGRGNQEDRERGMDVGANAYLVKSSFDQSNLLDVIRRLV